MLSPWELMSGQKNNGCLPEVAEGEGETLGLARDNGGRFVTAGRPPSLRLLVKR